MRATYLLFILFFLHNAAYAQVSIEQIDLVPGKYKVGFTHYTTFDSSRTYNRIFDWTNEYSPRPIPISTWYPSNEKSSDDPLTVLYYMRILKEEEEWEHLPDEQILNWFDYPNTVSNRNHLIEETTAFSKLRPAIGKFPLIIYAPSYQASSIENFVLCEFLASQGYVVVSSPSKGTENQFLEGGTEKDMETQARDIEFLIEVGSQLPFVDDEKIVTMGFSFGGLSQILAQMRDRRIKAIVSLDGSIQYQIKTLKKSSFNNFNKVNVPFIHFSQKKIPHDVLVEDNIDAALNYEFEFFDSLRYSDAYHYKFHHLTHSYFSTLGVLFQPRDLRQDRSDTEIMESYRWMCTYTLNFLNAYLKMEESGLAFLHQATSEITMQEGLISKVIKHSESRNFTFQDFNDLAKEKGYGNLMILYDSIKNEHPDLEINEGNLNNLGLQLVFNPEKSQDGINVLLFATTLYPNSANLWDSLAEGYLYIDDRKQAIKCFQKSLQLNPENQNAYNRLKELE